MNKRTCLYTGGVLVLVALRIFLVRHQPIWGIVVNQPYDENHFVDQAESILTGHWLGAYDHFTLIKGPFYPLWIVLTFLAGIPLLTSEHLLYIGAVLVFTAALRPLMRREGEALFLLAALLFNPFSYDTYAATPVVREFLYVSFCVLALAGAIALFLRRQESPLRQLPWALTAAGAFALGAVTREETVWLVPPLAVIFLMSWSGMRGVGWRTQVLRLGAWALIPAVYFLSMGVVSLINLKYYSLYGVTEMNAPEFVAAFSALQRVAPEDFAPKIPVPAEARRRMYAVSPAFKELEPFLEGEVGLLWSNPESGEMLSWAFLWAFREAVAAAGHYSSGRFPAEYYRTLAREVNGACTSGQLACVEKFTSLAPPWNEAYARPLLAATKQTLTYLVSFAGFTPYPVASITDSGPRERQFRDLTQTELSEPASQPRMSIKGWVVSEGHDVRVVVVQENREPWADTTIVMRPSPDVQQWLRVQGKDLPGAAWARFEIVTSCVEHCALEIHRGAETVKRVALDGLRAPAGWDDGQTVGYVDSVERYDGALRFQVQYNQWKMAILESIGGVYQRISPYVLVMAMAAFAILTVWMRSLRDAWVVVAVLLLTVVCRVGMLAVLVTVSFPDDRIHSLYLSPAYPIMIAFAVMAPMCAGTALLRRFRQQPS